MNTTEKQFHIAQKKLRNRSLSRAQKSSMLASIYNEVPVAATTPSPLLASSSFMRFIKSTPFAFVVLAFFMIGTTFASAKSLPGDFLYGMKTNVLEPLISNLQIGEEAKEKYQEKLLERRIREVRTLQIEGRFNEEEKEDSIEATIDIISTDNSVDATHGNTGVDINVNSDTNSNTDLGADFNLDIGASVDMTPDVNAVPDTPTIDTSTDTRSIHEKNIMLQKNNLGL